MPRFAANLTMMYNEHAFLDRFAAAAKDGFKAVEFLFPYDFRAGEIKARLEAQRSDAGALQCATRRLGRGRTRHRFAAGPRRRISPQHRNRARLHARARQSQTACDGRLDRRGSAAGASIARCI